MNNHENWYKTFFNGLAVELWHYIPTPAFTQSEVDFIKEISGIKANGKILDVPCGSGRHTLALAAQGFHLTGVDISPENICMLRAAAGTLPISAVCADIMEYTIEDAHDAAICMGNSFSYFPYDRMVQFAAKICNALKPGGVFIVNSGTIAESLCPH